MMRSSYLPVYIYVTACSAAYYVLVMRLSAYIMLSVQLLLVVFGLAYILVFLYTYLLRSQVTQLYWIIPLHYSTLYSILLDTCFVKLVATVGRNFQSFFDLIFVLS